MRAPARVDTISVGDRVACGEDLDSPALLVTGLYPVGDHDVCIETEHRGTRCWNTFPGSAIIVRVMTEGSG